MTETKGGPTENVTHSRIHSGFVSSVGRQTSRRTEDRRKEMFKDDLLELGNVHCTRSVVYNVGD